MGLVWSGEDEVETVITAFEASAAFAVDDEEAIVAALFGALVEALYQAQVSGNAVDRWAEDLVNAGGDRCAPVCATAIMDLATKSHIMRGELNNVNLGPTLAELLLAAQATAVYDATAQGRAH